MTANPTPKADRLREQREENFQREQARQKLEAEQRAKMSIKPRQKIQQEECKAAEDKIARRARNGGAAKTH